VGGEERLGPDEARLEEVFLALRTREGIPLRTVETERAEPYLTEGLLRRRDDRLVPTDRGMFLANEVAVALVG
jgi:coproporphyrinogen III oxidase-like Fe-S oxidoreductase